jgi:hypothetical protein
VADYLRDTARLPPARDERSQREFRHERIASVALSPDGRCWPLARSIAIRSALEH